MKKRSKDAALAGLCCLLVGLSVAADNRSGGGSIIFLDGEDEHQGIKYTTKCAIRNFSFVL